MTTVYSPLPNASPSQPRGAVTNAEQHLGGKTWFDDGAVLNDVYEETLFHAAIESEAGADFALQVLAQSLVINNDYTPEEVEIESIPFAIAGLPLRVGGPLGDGDDPWWGLSGSSLNTGGPLGVASVMQLGLHSGDAETDVGEWFEYGAGHPLLRLVAFSGGGSAARLAAADVALGLDATGENPALELSDGLDNPLARFYAPLELGHGSPGLWRFNYGTAFNFAFPLAGAIDSEQYVYGVHALSASSRGAWYVLDGSRIEDQAISDYLDNAHVFGVAGSGAYLAAFGAEAGGEYTSALRVHKSGALERERYVAAADAGTDDGSGNFTHDAGDAPTGTFSEAAAALNVVTLIVQSSAVKADSIITLSEQDRLQASNMGVMMTAYVSARSSGQFTISFRWYDYTASQWRGGLLHPARLHWSVER